MEVLHAHAEMINVRFSILRSEHGHPLGPGADGALVHAEHFFEELATAGTEPLTGYSGVNKAFRPVRGGRNRASIDADRGGVPRDGRRHGRWNVHARRTVPVRRLGPLSGV